MSGDGRLTREQEAIRLKGLRILARIIVRAHLRSLMEKKAGRNASMNAVSLNGDIPVKEGEGAD